MKRNRGRKGRNKFTRGAGPNAGTSGLIPKNYKNIITQFLNNIFQETEGYIEIRAIKDKSPKQFFYNSPEEIDVDKLKKLNTRGYNIYFSTCTRREKSGKENDVYEVPGIWIDVDGKDHGGKEQAKEHIDKVARGTGICPSITVDSGGGYHLYFLLKEPEVIQGEEDIQRVKGYVKGISSLFGGDHTHDLSRVLRLPGLKNLKYRPPSDCYIVDCDNDNRYNLLDFEEYKVEINDLELADVNIEDIPDEIPERFTELLKTDIKLNQIWSGKYKTNDESGSGIDMALAMRLVNYGFSDGEIARILLESPYHKQNERTEAYLSHTISKAKAQNSNHNKDYDKDLELIPIPKHEVLPFPLEVYPERIQNIVNEYAESIGCPVDFIAVPLLSALGTVIGGSVCIEIKKGWREHARIWTAIIGDPGCKKSPALELAIKPIHELQMKMKDKYEERYAEYEEDLEEYEHKLKEWKKSDKGTEKPEKPSEPVMPQIYITDSTIEALAGVLEENPHGLLFFRDELTGWVKQMDQYKKYAGSDRQKWLSFWSGGNEIINRKSDKTHIMLNKPFICVTGGLPPEVMGDLQDIQGREDGFTHRILFSYPEVSRYKYTDKGIKSESEDYMETIFGDIFASYRESTSLTFSKEAKSRWEDFVNSHRTEQDDVLLSDTLKGVWSKMEGYAARLALVLQTLDDICNEEMSSMVELKNLEGAIKLIEYFKSHAKKVYAYLQSTPVDKQVDKLIEWTRDKGGSVTTRDVQQSKVAGIKKAEEAKDLFEEIQSRGYGKVEYGKKGGATLIIAEDNP